MSIKTINVIDFKEPFKVFNLLSYPNTAEGVEEAKAKFVEWIKIENDFISDEELATALETGNYELGEGAILLVRSD